MASVGATFLERCGRRAESLSSVATPRERLRLQISASPSSTDLERQQTIRRTDATVLVSLLPPEGQPCRTFLMITSLSQLLSTRQSS